MCRANDWTSWICLDGFLAMANRRRQQNGIRKTGGGLTLIEYSNAVRGVWLGQGKRKSSTKPKLDGPKLPQSRARNLSLTAIQSPGQSRTVSLNISSLVFDISVSAF